MRLRDPETHKFGDMSVQASSFHCCSPREDGLPFAEYKSVEIAVYPKEGGMCRPSELFSWLRPVRKLKAKKLDHLFEDGQSPVAGFVSREDEGKIRSLLS